MTEGRTASRSEERLVAYYLAHRESHPRCSRVRPEHLQCPQFRRAWERVLGMDTWTDEETGLPLTRLADLAAHFVSKGELEALERSLVHDWARRNLIHEGERILHELAEERLGIGEASASLRQILGETDAGTASGSRPLGEAIREAVTEWAEAVQNKADRRTVPMPLAEMRARLRGWVRGRLHVIGGRTSEHKTTLARMAAWYPAQHGFRTLFWTLEDKDTDLAARTIAAEIREFTTSALACGVLPDGFPRDGSMHTRTIALAEDKAAANMRVLDEAGVTLSRLLGTLRAEAARGLHLAVVDYLQLVEHDHGGDRDASFWRLVAAGLHRLAKETNAAIIATSQIDKVGSRQTDDRGVPSPSAMLYSSALMQDAFGVIMVGKPKRADLASREFRINVKKWKAGPTFGLDLIVDPAHDLIIEHGG